MIDVFTKANNIRKDIENSKASALASSYRDMMTFGAWKHLEGLMEKIKNDATKSIDDADITNMSIGLIAHAKGMREAISKLQKEINLAANGGNNA